MKRLLLFIVILLAPAAPALAQLTMVGGCAAAATSCTPVVKSGKTFASGQLIYTFAYKSSTTAPTLSSSPTFTQIDTASANSSSFRSGCAVSTSTTPASGTWANATAVVTLVYSGSPATTTANCLSTGVGGHTTASGNNTSTYTLTTITLTKQNLSSLVIGAIGSTAAVCTETGMAVEYSGTNISGQDIGPVSSFATKTCTGTSGYSKTNTVELLASALSPPTYDHGTGSYVTSTTVTISGPSGATLCYTTNGTTPAATTSGTCSTGTTYSTPITITTNGTVLKSIATNAGWNNSTELDATYTITAAGPHWLNWNHIAVGGTSHVGIFNGRTVGTATGNLGTWDRLLSPSTGGGGTFAVVHSTTCMGNTSGSTSLSCPITSTTAGNALLYLCANDNSSTATTTTPASTSLLPSSSSSLNYWLLASSNISAGLTSVSVSTGTYTALACVIAEVSGVGSLVTKDVAVGPVSGSFSNGAATNITGSVTTTHAKDVVLGVVCYASDPGIVTQGTGYTSIGEADYTATGDACFLEYQNVTSIGAYNPGATWVSAEVRYGATAALSLP